MADDTAAAAAAAAATADVALHDFQNIFSLTGKVAVVTGGSRGLGLHAASGLLQSGCSTVFIISRKPAACASAVRALNALPNLSPGARAYAIPADLSQVSEIERVVREVAKYTDHVDILFANAGATWGEEFLKTGEREGWDRVMDLNVKGVFFTVQKFTPLLQHSSSVTFPSRVIITGSVAGLFVGTLGAAGSYAYAASKAAVLHLVRNLAVELGPRHILVNGIAPGFFPSKMTNVLIERTGGSEAFAKANPNGRVGRPEDVAGAVVFLSSRAGGHVNGDTIVLDGGKVWGTNTLEKL